MYVVIAHGLGISYPVGVYSDKTEAIAAAVDHFHFRARKYVVSVWLMGEDEPKLIYRSFDELF